MFMIILSTIVFLNILSHIVNEEVSLLRITTVYDIVNHKYMNVKVNTNGSWTTRHSIRALTSFDLVNVVIALLGNRMSEQILCKFNYKMVNGKSTHVVSFLPNNYFQNKSYFLLIVLVAFLVPWFTSGLIYSITLLILVWFKTWICDIA